MHKRTRNTNLQKALGHYAPDANEFWRRVYERDPWQRQMHVSAALQEHSPLRTRGWGGSLGWSRFQLTADGRSYTVITMADDPAEWALYGAHAFRDFAHGFMGKVEYHHIVRQMDRDRAEHIAETERVAA